MFKPCKFFNKFFVLSNKFFVITFIKSGDVINKVFVSLQYLADSHRKCFKVKIDALNDSVDMLLILGVNANETTNMLLNSIQQQRNRTWHLMEDHLRQHNSFKLPKQERIRPATSNNNAINTLTVIAVNSHLSTRQLARDSGISGFSISRILRNNRMHPYFFTPRND